MRIGIGGSIGPFRASVSTRGFGVAAGPVSAGTSWRAGRRRRRGSELTGEEFVECTVIIVKAFFWLWPAGLAVLLCDQHGVTSAAGVWGAIIVAEAPWLTLVLGWRR